MSSNTDTDKDTYLSLSCVGCAVQVRSQGVAEELRCLGLLNALEKDQEIPESLVQLFGEPCIKLAQGIRAYVTKVGTTCCLMLP